jgi:hypothetical protein
MQNGGVRLSRMGVAEKALSAMRSRSGGHIGPRRK